jgi:hypothetical protein
VDHIDFISSHAGPAWHISTFPGSRRISSNGLTKRLPASLPISKPQAFSITSRNPAVSDAIAKPASMKNPPRHHMHKHSANVSEPLPNLAPSPQSKNQNALPGIGHPSTLSTPSPNSNFPALSTNKTEETKSTASSTKFTVSTCADYFTNTNDKYGSTPSSPTQAATSTQASKYPAEPS